MRLAYFPVNAAWAFIFGDSPTALDGWPLFFTHRSEAVHAAACKGITVNGRGQCAATPTTTA